MRVKTDHYRLNHRTHTLSDLLTPQEYPEDYRDDGERALALARKTAEAYGRLAELLVEKGVITLDEASVVSGFNYSLEKAK